MKSNIIKGVVPALTVPFDSERALDIESYAKLVEMVVNDGVDGLLINGCTGESWSLDADERMQVFRTSVEVARKRLPVVAGCSAISAREAIGKIRQAEKAGCDIAMVSPPWYVLPGKAEIMDYYAKVLDATELPVLLYNIPRRTGVHLTLDMVDQLADHPKVIAIKESSKDWGTLSSIIRKTRDRIGVFAGYASFFGLAALTEGAIGYMDSGTPVFRRESPAFYRAATSGDLATARRLQIEMAQMLEVFFGLGTFPAAIKAALDILGRPGGYTRDPILPLNAAQRKTVEQALLRSRFLDKAA